MAKKLGIFKTEQEVIDTVAALEQAGFVPGELQIIAKDSEHSRRIEAETDIHADEVMELARTNGSRGMNEGTTIAAAAVMPTTGMTGAGGWSAVPMTTDGLLATNFISDDDGINHALRALGLDKAEDESREAIRAGSIIVVVETDESHTMMDKEGGPKLARLSIAESVFRSQGAVHIADI
ncbi:general stress protein [Paenibacillus sp. Leaf72]|uniref:general stress protein n=1 Tax=Paenibacillus sp. Leaf72 TaxID=1736234 RepID=UPI0006F3D286|nr:general stress protein [Paenibacillus sp. Leaf72]KQO09544.1 hypothetical protein ASF12_31755 [Paenibacillus sp. Leaf72]